MVFNSIDFVIFFTTVFIFQFIIPGRFRWILLLAASYFFYMYWEVSYILLIIFSTLIDYFVGLYLFSSRDPNRRKTGLIVSVVCNLGLLFVFKYYNFFQDTISYFLSSLDVSYVPNKHELLLPVGISFFTFQTMSYTIDVYRRTLKPERHLGKFALYVSFFPQLVAGPIERAKNLLPQLNRDKINLDSNSIISGFLQAIFGFFKKVVVADTLAIQVDSIFNNYQFHGGWAFIIATYLFAFQIYCDFSGYSDIAIGVARMLGYDLMENFRLPYFSKSISEFWRRWHISLSSWLRDYLYIPLGGNRRGRFKTVRNLMITMLLGGLWHGASWTFVVWGGLNGVYLVVEKFLNRWWYKVKPKNGLFIRFFRVFFIFNLISLTWVFFRSHTFAQAKYILGSIFRLDGSFTIKDSTVFANLLIGLFVLLAMEYGFMRKENFYNNLAKRRLVYPVLFASFFFIMILLFGVSNGSQFIYFQF